MIAAIERTTSLQIHRDHGEPQDTQSAGPESDPQFAEVVSILRQISESLRLIADRQPAQPPVRPVESNQMRAMKALVEMGPGNLTRIAEAVGVNRRTLHKWPAFMEAVHRMRAASHWTPRDPRCVRGHADGELA